MTTSTPVPGVELNAPTSPPMSAELQAVLESAVRVTGEHVEQARIALMSCGQHVSLTSVDSYTFHLASIYARLPEWEQAWKGKGFVVFGDRPELFDCVLQSLLGVI